jgi:hypothetical protein
MDLAMGVAQLAVFLVFVAMFIPSVRKMIFGFGVFAIILAVVVVVGIFLIRRTARPSRTSTSTFGRYEVTTTPAEKPLATTDDLFQQLRVIDWFQFEKVVELTYRKQGYKVTRRGGANPDGGIDLVIEKDGQRQAVQCKHWKTWTVGVKPVREFLGALTDAGIERGIFITLGGYTGDARNLAEKHGIEMLNETGLAQMLESVNAKYDPEVLSLLKDTRKFCPRCERLMVQRKSRTGGGFWGCSGYPRCRFTMQIN